MAAPHEMKTALYQSQRGLFGVSAFGILQILLSPIQLVIYNRLEKQYVWIEIEHRAKSRFLVNFSPIGVGGGWVQGFNLNTVVILKLSIGSEVESWAVFNSITGWYSA